MEHLTLRVFKENKDGNDWIATATGLEEYGTGTNPLEAILNFFLRSFIYFLSLQEKNNLNKYEESQLLKLERLQFDNLKSDDQLTFLTKRKCNKIDDFNGVIEMNDIVNLDENHIISAFENIIKKYMAYQKICEGYFALTTEFCQNQYSLSDFNTMQYFKYKGYLEKYEKWLNELEEELLYLLLKNKEKYNQPALELVQEELNKINKFLIKLENKDQKEIF